MKIRTDSALCSTTAVHSAAVAELLVRCVPERAQVSEKRSVNRILSVPKLTRQSVLLHRETEPCIYGGILSITTYFKESNDALTT